MQNVTDRTSNPFGMRPSCDRYVPGYGDANANFHVVGDHPRVHGGIDTGVPFTNDAGLRLQRALNEGGLLQSVGVEPEAEGTFLSYLHMCEVDGDRDPTPAEYGDMERFFDAELRAIAAHVLLPVGLRATTHVLENYSAQLGKVDLDMDRLHGTEIRGSGFLVVPIKEPAEWTDGDGGDPETNGGEGAPTDHDRLVAGLRELQSTDFRREVDLGRFLAGDESYMVR
ncbi:uracil-DNA glycosylase family protein [Halobium salinum]|uniref:Uracil-DNA glycosylase family protein n=1 Tax=Halobium salinum TaxID=1364940 RepID=A0ABD5PHD5_9EURY|nr:uracil-DNA glycosylase family protein [Halobium salinum]